MNLCVFSILFLLISFNRNVHALTIQDYEKKIKTAFSIKSVVEKLSRKEIEEDLRLFVASARPNRAPGSPGHKKAMEYIENNLKSHKGPLVTVSNNEFSLDTKSELAGMKGYNLIWEKKGATKPDEVIILGAHYDTVLYDQKNKKILFKGEMPGANNNASGVAALLSMIKVFNLLDLPKTVMIVFFDLEELRSEGSKAFVHKLFSEIGGRRIVGFFNLSGIAHDTKKSDTEQKLFNMALYAREESNANSAADAQLASLLLENTKRLNTMIDFKVYNLDLKETSKLNMPLSTEAFWNSGVPAIIVSHNRLTDLDPRLYTTNDFIETLNINTYINVFKSVAGSVLAWNYDVVK